LLDVLSPTYAFIHPSFGIIAEKGLLLPVLFDLGAFISECSLHVNIVLFIYIYRALYLMNLCSWLEGNADPQRASSHRQRGSQSALLAHVHPEM